MLINIILAFNSVNPMLTIIFLVNFYRISFQLFCPSNPITNNINRNDPSTIGLFLFLLMSYMYPNNILSRNNRTATLTRQCANRMLNLKILKLNSHNSIPTRLTILMQDKFILFHINWTVILLVQGIPVYLQCVMLFIQQTFITSCRQSEKLVVIYSFINILL